MRTIKSDESENSTDYSSGSSSEEDDLYWLKGVRKRIGHTAVVSDRKELGLDKIAFNKITKTTERHKRNFILRRKRDSSLWFVKITTDLARGQREWTVNSILRNSAIPGFLTALHGWKGRLQANDSHQAFFLLMPYIDAYSLHHITTSPNREDLSDLQLLDGLRQLVGTLTQTHPSYPLE